LVLARQVGDAHWTVALLHNLGLVAGRQGKYERAEVLLAEAIDLEKTSSGGTVTAELMALYNNLAIVAKHLQDYERAESLLRASLEYKREQGDQLGVAISLANLGELALVREDHDSAAPLFRESLQLRQALDDEKGMLILLAGLAELALARGERVRSIRLYSASQSLRQQTGFPMTERERTQQEHNVAILYEQLGKADFATAWEEGASMTLEQAVACAQGAGASPHL
jgi:tetratricopeptide (TPR) repeat protein